MNGKTAEKLLRKMGREYQEFRGNLKSCLRIWHLSMHLKIWRKEIFCLRLRKALLMTNRQRHF